MLSLYFQEHFDKNIVKALCSVAIAPGKVKDFNSQGIAMTFNALAKFGHFDENLVQALCSGAQALEKVKYFNSQAIATTLFALAT